MYSMQGGWRALMKNLLLIVLCGLISTLASFLVINQHGPNNSELDSDMALIRIQIDDANNEIKKYKSGIIYTEIELRTQILKNTLAMLESKKLSVLRGVSLQYQDSMSRYPAQDPDIERELAAAKNDAAQAHTEAAQYSGGLIRTLAIAKEAAVKVTVASLQQRMELARAGIPLPALGAKVSVIPPPVGTITSDKDAL